MVTFADKNDKAQLKKMWQSIFLEDASVTDYFFEVVYDKILTPVIRCDEKIVSSLFLLDCKIGKFKGKCVYCAMTGYGHRGKGYMKTLLDFSYKYCTDNGFDFLFLVPAEKSLFEYYGACGFENFGISRAYTVTDSVPQTRDLLKYDCEIEFDESVIKHWHNSCIAYDGEITEFGLVFSDGEAVIRNARGNYEAIPDTYKKSGTIIKGDIAFGEDYSPAMVRTDSEELKAVDCYIGITLE